MNRATTLEAAGAAPLASAEMREWTARALLIRRFEELLLRLFSEGKLNGTVHTCLGQEWIGVAVAAALQPADTVFSNHRGHGHYLARHRNPEGLLAEIMGRATGVCGGFGGSQHLCDRGFYSNGILGGMSPVAVGRALAHRLDGDGGVTIAFHGDGALGEGVIYEAMNLAARWSLPALWVIERNGYAQSTHCGQTLAGTVEGRAAAFGLRYFHGDTWNVEALFRTAREAVAHVRTHGTPALLEVETFRLAAHSKGDDNRDPAEVESFRQKDSLQRLLDRGGEELAAIDREIRDELAGIVARCEAAPRCQFTPRSPHRSAAVKWSAPPAASAERYSTLLHEALGQRLAADPRLMLLGEDIEGGYGGAFKVTRDLSQRYPGRVRNTPISEATIVGAGTGLALAGHRPIVEIMFGDFLGLTFDQLQQHACKFETMFNGRARVPLVVRTPMGGRRGYGPTHSQSIEAHFLGIPELLVVALNARVDPRTVYQTLAEQVTGPTLVIENKILYTRPFAPKVPRGFRVQHSDELFPTVRLAPAGEVTPQVTVVCYGGMLEIAEEALGRAFLEREIVAEIVCPTQLAPFNAEPVVESVRRTGRLLLLEEGKTFAAFGSEVIARVAEAGVTLRTRRLGYDHFIPASFELENELLPNVGTVLEALVQLIR